MDPRPSSSTLASGRDYHDDVRLKLRAVVQRDHRGLTLRAGLLHAVDRPDLDAFLREGRLYDFADLWVFAVCEPVDEFHDGYPAAQARERLADL